MIWKWGIWFKGREKKRESLLRDRWEAEWQRWRMQQGGSQTQEDLLGMKTRKLWIWASLSWERTGYLAETVQSNAKFPEQPSREQGVSQAPEPWALWDPEGEILKHESNTSNYGNGTESQFCLALVWSSTHGRPSLPQVTWAPVRPREGVCTV